MFHMAFQVVQSFLGWEPTTICDVYDNKVIPRSSVQMWRLTLGLGDAEAVGTTLKRRMQTTPFLGLQIGGAVATKGGRSSSSFTSLPFQQHLTFNRPDAHPPPPLHGKGRNNTKGTDERETNKQGQSIRFRAHCFNDVGGCFAPWHPI